MQWSVPVTQWNNECLYLQWLSRFASGCSWALTVKCSSHWIGKNCASAIPASVFVSSSFHRVVPGYLPECMDTHWNTSRSACVVTSKDFCRQQYAGMQFQMSTAYQGNGLNRCAKQSHYSSPHLFCICFQTLQQMNGSHCIWLLLTLSLSKQLYTESAENGHTFHCSFCI